MEIDKLAIPNVSNDRPIVIAGPCSAESREQVLKTAEELSKQGKTPLFFEEEGKLLGIIAVADTIKEDSPEILTIDFRFYSIKLLFHICHELLHISAIIHIRIFI